MTWGLWGHTAALFDPSDSHYFPGYHFGPGDEDENDPALPDLQNAWVIGEGMDRRKPHIQRGVTHGPAHPDAPLTDTERHLQNMGHEFATRIHQAEPTDDHLYRGMTVPPEWLDAARQTGSVTLPLSSFDYDPGTAGDYSRHDPDRSSSSRRGSGVVLRLDPGAKTVPLIDSESVTHGDFDVHDVHPMNDQEDQEYGPFHGHERPTVMHIRQRSVPAPAGTHTASRIAMPTWYHLTDDPNFRLDPDKVPVNLNYPEAAGVFLTQRPEEWARDSDPAWPGGHADEDEWNGNRPYVAEIDAPENLHTLPGARHLPDSTRPGEEPGADETFVPADQFHHLTVQNVRPRTAMPAPLPSHIVLRHHRDPHYPKVTAHDINAPEGEDQIAYLEWNGHRFHPTGEIADIQVNPAYRGNSIATSMFDFAKQHEPRLHHSDDLTEAGEGWSNYEQSRNKKANTMTAAVTVYTQPNCPQCNLTKLQLQRLGIEHDTVDVTADPDAHAYVTGLGYSAAPVVVAGEDHWSGFRPDRLRGLVE